MLIYFCLHSAAAACSGIEPSLKQADKGVMNALNQYLSSLSMTSDSIRKLPGNYDTLV